MTAFDAPVLPLAFFTPSPGEMAVIVIIALLIYGGDLPEVARTWGRHFQEFRRHLNGIRSELNDVIYAEPEPVRQLQYHPEFHNQELAARDVLPSDAVPPEDAPKTTVIDAPATAVDGGSEPAAAH